MLPKIKQERFHGVQGILAKLWNQILLDLNISPEFLRTRVVDYVQANKKTAVESTASRREYTSNILGQLTAKDMTWKNLYRGISIIGVVKVGLSVELHFKRRAPTVHSIEFEIMKNSQKEEDDAPE